MKRTLITGILLATVMWCSDLCKAVSYSFSTGDPNGLIATASRPESAGKIEIESADDFIVPITTRIDTASFTGLVPSSATVGQVVVEIYRVFPNDSTNPPSGKVPTRVNSPSDVAFDTRDSAGGTLAFTTTTLASSFTANNSVLNGINPIPGQTTGGEGAVTGQEVRFDVTFATPFLLPADHYFFVPQVQVSSGDFFWLSAPRPIVPPGTPFNPDLQSWIRNANLDPDWLKVGGDIVGQGQAFNATFALNGKVVPEPISLASVLLATAGLGGYLRKRRCR